MACPPSSLRKPIACQHFGLPSCLVIVLGVRTSDKLGSLMLYQLKVSIPFLESSQSMKHLQPTPAVTAINRHVFCPAGSQEKLDLKLLLFIQADNVIASSGFLR